MTNAVAKEHLRQLTQQKANLQNTIADTESRIEVVETQITALQKLVSDTAPAPENSTSKIQNP